MHSQPPLLGGSVGNLAEVRNPFSIFVQMLGFAPPLEERRFVCDHCGCDMTKDYLVWHMNAKCVTPTFLSPRGMRTDCQHLDINKSPTRTMCRPGISRRECSTSVTKTTTVTRVILKPTSRPLSILSWVEAVGRCSYSVFLLDFLVYFISSCTILPRIFLVYFLWRNERFSRTINITSSKNSQTT